LIQVEFFIFYHAPPVVVSVLEASIRCVCDRSSFQADSPQPHPLPDPSFSLFFFFVGARPEGFSHCKGEGCGPAIKKTPSGGGPLPVGPPGAVGWCPCLCFFFFFYLFPFAGQEQSFWKTHVSRFRVKCRGGNIFRFQPFFLYRLRESRVLILGFAWSICFINAGTGLASCGCLLVWCCLFLHSISELFFYVWLSSIGTDLMIGVLIALPLIRPLFLFLRSPHRITFRSFF